MVYGRFLTGALLKMFSIADITSLLSMSAPVPKLHQVIEVSDLTTLKTKANYVAIV